MSSHLKSRDHISEKIEHLFNTVRRADGREFTYDDVERGTDKRVSRSYVWKLRHGRNQNPSLDVLEAMSEFFRVPPEYFFGLPLKDDADAQEAAAVAALLQDKSARRIAERAVGLSPAAVDMVSNLLDNLHQMAKA